MSPLPFLHQTWSLLRKNCRMYFPCFRSEDGDMQEDNSTSPRVGVSGLSRVQSPFWRSQFPTQYIHNSGFRVIVLVKMWQRKDGSLRGGQVTKSLFTSTGNFRECMQVRRQKRKDVVRKPGTSGLSREGEKRRACRDMLHNRTEKELISSSI